ncbi:hypothetical protein AMECASPLE_005418 [Ameca splendens]|uniref:Uncharacterized protein n=1 Tax=Ameca splendens TaxID=208324 RepID=A0ABV0YXB2_9TELE
MVQVLYSNLNHAVALPVCLRLLSSCRGKLFFIAPSIFSSPLTNFRVITEEKHLHTMMLPPLYLYISEILKRIMHHIPSSSQLCSTLCFAIVEKKETKGKTLSSNLYNECLKELYCPLVALFKKVLLLFWSVFTIKKERYVLEASVYFLTAITYNHNKSTLKTLGPMGQNMKEAKMYA